MLRTAKPRAPDELRVRTVKLFLDSNLDTVVAHIAYNADHGRPGTGLIALANPTTDGILARPISARHSLVDQRDLS
jgi:hypothetical protein